MSDPIRAFFAIDVDGPSRRAAAGVRDVLRDRPHGDGVRWLRDEAFHVTLRFLGDVAADRLPDLVSRVSDEIDGERGFRLALGAVDAFPSKRRPRVIVLALDPEEPVVRLASAVDRGVVAAGFEAEPRPFRGHLTLGRVRPGRRAPSLDDVPAAEAPAFAVQEVVLYQSELSPDGAHHIPRERLPLASESLTP